MPLSNRSPPSTFKSENAAIQALDGFVHTVDVVGIVGVVVVAVRDGAAKALLVLKSSAKATVDTKRIALGENILFI